MGKWVQPFKRGLEVLHSGLMGDKKKLWAEGLVCPYHDCPSNQPEPNSRPPRMKFIQMVQPYVRQYKCQWCGFPVNFGNDGPGVPHVEKPHVANSNFLHRKL